MSKGPEWFAPKRYGYGAGLPIAWQGWGLLLGYVALMIGAGVMLERRPVAMMGLMVPLTAGFLLVTARTTRGGWRWRSGERD